MFNFQRIDIPQTYARSLFSQKGNALWYPQPRGMAQQFQAAGIRIGDVGHYDGMGFETLFNVLVDADDPINQLGVPKSFQRLSLDEGCLITKEKIPPCVLGCGVGAKERVDPGLRSMVAPSVIAGEPEFAGYSRDAAHPVCASLHLPNGAWYLSAPPECFRDYALLHAPSWYAFANGGRLNRRIPSGLLFLVTSCIKTDSFLAAIDQGVDFLPFYRTNPGFSFDSRSANICTMGASASSDSLGDPSAPGGCNQSVFFRGFHIAVRDCLYKRPDVNEYAMRSVIEDRLARRLPFRRFMHNIFHHNEGRDPSSISGWFYHPSMALNRFLLRAKPKAKVALTHDDDWCSLLEMDSSFHWEDLKNHVAVKNGGAFFHSLPKSPERTFPATCEWEADVC